MQRIFSGATLARRSRITRCARTKVLPDPALAETHADTAGLEASICRCSTLGGMTRLMRKAPVSASGAWQKRQCRDQRSSAASHVGEAGFVLAHDGPLFHPGEVIVGAIACFPH